MKHKKLTKEERGEEGFNIHRQVVKREKERRVLFLENVKDISYIYDKQLYKDILGSEEATWSGYLAEIEIYYSRNEVISWINIRKKLTIELNINPAEYVYVPISRLTDIANIAKDTTQAIDLIGHAKLLNPLDWKNILAELKGQPTSETCKHNYKLYRICKVYGLKHQVT